MKHLLLDANVLVRFLVQDDAKQAPAATALFEKAGRNEIVLHLDVLAVAETVYVLMGRYGQTRKEVADALLALTQNAGIQTAELPAVTSALQRFGTVNVDFSDAWLAACSEMTGNQVASFDRDFDKFKDVKRFEPSA
jgi:predicted nucleic-acid-binding protein